MYSAKRLKFNDRAALFITKWGGCMSTFWAFALIYGAWMAWNTYTPKGLHFDSAEFALLLFISNFIQLQYLPAIQTGTNILGAESEKRSLETHELVKSIHEENQAEAERRHTEHMDELAAIRSQLFTSGHLEEV